VPESEDLETLWKAVNDELHKGELIPSLWEAVRTAKPLAIADGRLVVGMGRGQMGLGSHMTVGPNRARLEQIIEHLAGERLTLEVIEGQSLEAWESRRQREMAVRERVEGRAAALAEAQAAGATWDNLREQLTVKFAQHKERRYPQHLARYLLEALQMVVKMASQLAPSSPAEEEAQQRQLARILEKVAQQCGLPSALVALEYHRLQAGAK